MRLHVALPVALGLALAACSPAALAPTAQAPTPGTSPASPTTAATAAATPGGGDPGGNAGGRATVTLGGETYQLATGDPPLCTLTVGVQVGMHSEDRQTSLTVHALGDLDAFNFALITPDDRWVPAEGSSRFQVAGSQATWSGTLVGQHTDRQEPGAIDITCGG